MLQNRSLNEKLNPVEITIHHMKYNQNYLGTVTNVKKYRFIVNSPLFSSSIVQEIKVIFLISNGINDARTSLINEKIYKSIGVVNVNKRTNGTDIKRKI